MRIAVLSDIHANLPALRAVLDDVARQGVDRTVHLGDLVGDAPFPNEVVEAIRSHGLSGVRGPFDEAVGFGPGEASARTDSEAAERSLLWTRENTRAENRRFLATLPFDLHIEVEDRTIHLFHAHPAGIDRTLPPDAPPADLAAAVEASGASILVFGGTHLPYHTVVRDRHLVNAGSVGRPLDGDVRAAYAILAVDGTIDVLFRRVPYDVEETARAIAASALPNELADALRRAAPLPAPARA